MEPISYLYRFKMTDGAVQEFSFKLDGETMALLREPKKSSLPWTRLDYHQCPNCPLSAGKHPQCPVAANLSDLVDFFKDSVSSDVVELEIINPERTVSKKTSVANAISAMVGVVMVTSGCPIMDKLRPMLRTHLPFSSIDETLYRTLTMYLFAQYLIYKDGGKPDWDMVKLVDIFEDIRTVNRSFCQRLYGTCIKDASVNAVIHLDSFVELTNFALVKKRERLDRIKQVFAAYLPDAKS